MIPDLRVLEQVPLQSTPATNLPEEFWTARPSLARIRQAAHSRHRSADAVFHVVLARVSGMIEPARIDTGVGSPASLNYFAALIGPSGAGKSDAEIIGCDLYPAPAGAASWFADRQPLGTGEGLAEAYMGTIQEKAVTGRGKPTTLREQVRHNAFFFVDEGEALSKYLERSGATIGESLRRAWKGGPIGQRNGSADRTRIVVDYSLGLAIGFQHTTVRPLLEDVAAGTPQRFVFASATDSTIPNEHVPWPEPTKWFTQFAENDSWSVDDEVLEEIRGLDLMTTRQELTWEPYDAHATLTRVKIAGLLAALEMRKRITAEDWQLAGIAWRTSQAVRDALIVEAQTEASERVAAGHKRAATRELVIDEAKEDKAMRIAIDTIVRHVARNACDGGCKRRCIRNSIAGKHRALISPDAAIEQAVNRGLIHQRGDIYYPGAAQ